MLNFYQLFYKVPTYCISTFTDRVERQKIVCDAMHELIEECTVILGWCYTSSQVEDTKEKQKLVMDASMKDVFPYYIQKCLSVDDNVRLPSQPQLRQPQPLESGAIHTTLTSMMMMMTMTLVLWRLLS